MEAKGKGQPRSGCPFHENTNAMKAGLQLLLCGGGCGSFGSGVCVFLGETLDAARGVQELLLASEERVAI